MSMSKEEEILEKIKSLQRSRVGKKGSITKRVAYLKRLVLEGGCRTRLRFLVSALLEVHRATQTINDEILQLSENDQVDISWIEDVNFLVYDCISEVHEYLEARKDDPPSNPSIAESWVQKH